MYYKNIDGKLKYIPVYNSIESSSLNYNDISNSVFQLRYFLSNDQIAVNNEIEEDRLKVIRYAGESILKVFRNSEGYLPILEVKYSDVLVDKNTTENPEIIFKTQYQETDPTIFTKVNIFFILAHILVLLFWIITNNIWGKTHP